MKFDDSMRNGVSHSIGNGDTNGHATDNHDPSHKHNELFFAGRLSSQMSTLLRQWNETPRLAWELRNLSHVLRVDRAHCIMLAEQGHMTNLQAGAVLRELDAIDNAQTPNLSIQPGSGSIVLQIERRLADQIGADAAGLLPIARSRLDQGATVKRMSDRNNILDVVSSLLRLQETLLRVAGKHADTPMISYTHLQQAQPANFGHYLLAFKERLDDTCTQLRQLYARVDRCPLGAVGLSGTDLSIDRRRTAALLGFSDLQDNSRTGRDAYYQIEIVFVLSIILTVLNDLCTDLHVFSSVEFGTVEMHDSHCSTSSIFPQKKNPYALETIKGKGAEATGWVASALATFRNEGTGDNQARTVACLAEAFNTTMGMLDLAAEVLEQMTVNRARWETLLGNAWVTTNRLGNILLTKYGMNYRRAHGVVARLVKNCLEQNINRADVTLEMLQNAAMEMHVEPVAGISQDELRAALDHTAFIESVRSFGGVGPVEVKRLQVKGGHVHNAAVAWVQEQRKMLLDADTILLDTADGYVRLLQTVNGN